MNKRKLRFNAVDVLIILFIAAAAFVLLYVFVLSDRSSDAQIGDPAKIEYVVQIQNVDSRFAESVRRGQHVEDAITRKSIGNVIGVEPKPYEKISFDSIAGREVISEVEGRITLLVTIEADVRETDRAFLADGCDIRVGKQFSLIFPDFYGVGYCTALTKK